MANLIIKSAIIEKINNGEKHPIKKFNKYKNTKHFVREIRRNSAHFNENSVNPVDIVSDVLVTLDQNDERITRQGGHLIVLGKGVADKQLTEYQEDVSHRIDAYRLALRNKKIRIIFHNYKIILEQLSVLGINKATIYPDPDSEASFVSNQL